MGLEGVVIMCDRSAKAEKSERHNSRPLKERRRYSRPRSVKRRGDGLRGEGLQAIVERHTAVRLHRNKAEKG